jgi:hypothetical protein
MSKIALWNTAKKFLADPVRAAATTAAILGVAKTIDDYAAGRYSNAILDGGIILAATETAISDYIRERRLALWKAAFH